MITVTAPIWLWSEGKGHWHFLTVPPDQAVEIRMHSTMSGPRRGFGSVKVEATISDVTWRTSIFPQKDGGYLLPVKAEVRERAGLTAGEEVEVSLRLV